MDTGGHALEIATHDDSADKLEADLLSVQLVLATEERRDLDREQDL